MKPLGHATKATKATEPPPPHPDAGKVWHIELIALPHSAPAANRLRIFLKRALRDWKLKCIGITSKPKPPSSL